jgi:hypothetical protein
MDSHERNQYGLKYMSKEVYEAMNDSVGHRHNVNPVHVVDTMEGVEAEQVDHDSEDIYEEHPGGYVCVLVLCVCMCGFMCCVCACVGSCVVCVHAWVHVLCVCMRGFMCCVCVHVWVHVLCVCSCVVCVCACVLR